MDKLEFTQENFLSLYTNYLSLSAEIDALKSVVFGIADCLEMPNPAFGKGVRQTFYDCWGQLLKERSAFQLPTQSAGRQFDFLVNLELKRIHDLLEEVSDTD